MDEEFLKLKTAGDWRHLYTQICIESRNHDFTCVDALKVENRGLNRYRDVYPFDHSRVHLQSLSTTDYINASLVRVDTIERKYILAQGPLPSTVAHFWLMVWEQNSQAVLMLNRVIEKGTIKCHQYWPHAVGETVLCEDVGLSIENMGSEPGQNYTTANLRITNLVTEESRDVIHFHYTTWPDFGVPRCPDTFLQFLEAVRESGSLSSDVGPPVVHCSAGIGRSGTFCLVDSCLLMAEKEGPDKVSIKTVLLDMRRHRMGLIQTEDQLKFSYISILSAVKKLGLIDVDPEWAEPKVAEASESESEDDAPPPLPPPRSESLLPKELPVVAPQEIITLKSESMSAAKDADPHNSLPAKLESHMNGDDSGSKDDLSISSGTSSEKSSTDQDSPTKCILKSNKMEERKREMTLRRRKKDEERAGTEEKLLEMQKKMKASENNWSRRSAIFKEQMLPFWVGLAMFMAGGYYYFKN